jgi:sec-independent protein translocase protein TatB
MFEVGFTELLLIGCLALIVLGPERLPKLAQDLGRWVGRARAMARQLREQLDQEVHFQEESERRAQGPKPSSPSTAPPPDVDEYADPHDTRSHQDASNPEPESTAANCEPPPGSAPDADAAPATGESSPRTSP